MESKELLFKILADCLSCNHHHKRIIARRFRPTLRHNLNLKSGCTFQKSGFRALKEHQSRYIPTFIYDFTNTNHRVKSSLSMLSLPLCSGRSAFNHFHAILPLEWTAWFPQIFHTGHALHSPFRIINTLSTMSVSKWHASVDSCRRSRLNRVYRFCRFDLLFTLSYCINRALSRGRISHAQASELVQNDNSLTHNVQIKHRDYTNV